MNEHLRAPLEQVIDPLRTQFSASERFSKDLARSGAHREYFRGAADALDMLARTISQDWARLAREEFLKACGMQV